MRRAAAYAVAIFITHDSAGPARTAGFLVAVQLLAGDPRLEPPIVLRPQVRPQLRANRMRTNVRERDENR